MYYALTVCLHILDRVLPTLCNATADNKKGRQLQKMHKSNLWWIHEDDYIWWMWWWQFADKLLPQVWTNFPVKASLENFKRPFYSCLIWIWHLITSVRYGCNQPLLLTKVIWEMTWKNGPNESRRMLKFGLSCLVTVELLLHFRKVLRKIT